jgi:ATP-dependent protease ClpP protease subunit
MKSAYELAMEKLQKESPAQTLSEEKKAEIAELDNLYQSKLAEREVFLGGKIEEAKLAGDLEAHQQLERELTSDRKTIVAELEEKKEAVRNG